MRKALALMFFVCMVTNAQAHTKYQHYKQLHSKHSHYASLNKTENSSDSYEEYLQSRKPGQGLIPIADPDLRGILFVIGGLAGPAGLLFAMP